jgi:hypothetical protein
MDYPHQFMSFKPTKPIFTPQINMRIFFTLLVLQSSLTFFAQAQNKGDLKKIVKTLNTNLTRKTSYLPQRPRFWVDTKTSRGLDENYFKEIRVSENGTVTFDSEMSTNHVQFNISNVKIVAVNERSYKLIVNESPEKTISITPDQIEVGQSLQAFIDLAYLFPKLDKFNKGYARIFANGKMGLIDSTQSVIIPLEYDKVYDFIDGIAVVEVNGKVGIFDKKGNKSLIYDKIFAISEGLVGVILNASLALLTKPEKWSLN